MGRHGARTAQRTNRESFDSTMGSCLLLYRRAWPGRGEGGRQKGSEISVELRWDSARRIRHGEYDRSDGATTFSPTVCKGRRGVSWKMYRLSRILTSDLVNSRHYDLRNSPTRTATDVSGPDLDTVMPSHETVIHAEDPLAEGPMRRLSRGNGIDIPIMAGCINLSTLGTLKGQVHILPPRPNNPLRIRFPEL